MKKVLATVLALVMALALCTTSWADATGVTCDGTNCDHAAEFNGKHYAHLTDAYAALTRGGAAPAEAEVITLLKNSAGGGIGADADKNMNYVIDFAGHTYTVGKPAVGSTGTVTQGLRVMQTSTATFKNGTLKAADYNQLKQVVHTYGDVTLDNFTVDATEDSYAQVAVEPDCGTLNIIGNSSILAREGMTGLYVAFWHTGTYDGTTANVNTTGKITGKLVYEFDERKTGADAATENKGVLNIENGNFEIAEIETIFTESLADELKVPKISVSGGTYTVDVSKYIATDKIVQKDGGAYKVVADGAITSGTYTSQPTVPSGYKATKNDDGTWTVTKISYYYYPSTSDTTTSTTTKGSPKTFDAGVGIYAVTAVLSVTGMAWTAKKRGN